MKNSVNNKRVEVLKTHKIFIGGKFPRTESGRYYIVHTSEGEPVSNICRSSRKDFRDAVVAARHALEGWTAMTPINRGQILYRLAEMVEGRKTQFVSELILQGAVKNNAIREVEQSIDRIVYYAGWCDKFQQLFSTVNPVAAPYFNFSRPEPTGVVSVIAPESSPFLGFVSVLLPVIAGGNAAIILASEKKPLCAVTFAEAVHTSDFPAGVINILTGFRLELYSHFASHKDVNSIIYCGNDEEMISAIHKNSTINVKRTIIRRETNWQNENAQSPYFIKETQEIKTTWHPVGQ